VLFDLPNGVHPVREFAAGGQIGENHVPGVRKQQLRELVPLTRLPGNMEFHHKKSNSQTIDTLSS
jgi:hypothetical protein